jgi:large subunit ribosomal protein L22
MADDETLEETGVETPAAEEKPKPKRAPRKKAEPKAAVATEAAATEEKPKRAPRKKAEPKPEPVAAEAPVEETAAPVAKAPAARKTPAAPVSKRKRTAEPVAAGAPMVRAQAKYVRTSARKARLVCDHIRGKSVDEARAILAFTPRAVAKDWAKLLNSAVANAEHNHELLGDDLKVAAAYADEGPTLKRFQPRAMGRATRIRKRTSHLTITLTPKG